MTRERFVIVARLTTRRRQFPQKNYYFFTFKCIDRFIWVRRNFFFNI